MTNTVWKYTVPVQEDPINLDVPHGAEFLDAQPSPSQRVDEIDVWFRVDPDQKRTDHLVFVTRGTGDAVPPAANTHRSTCVMGRGPLASVVHLFEVTA